MVMRGALSIAALLLFSNTPVFANPDVIELDCEVEDGTFREMKEGSTKTTDDSDRGFLTSINKNDGTFYMIQDGRNGELVYANKFNEQGELASYYGHVFGYSKESSNDTYDLNTEEWGRIDSREIINIMYNDEDGYSFAWRIKEVTEGRYEATIAMYTGKCVRES